MIGTAARPRRGWAFLAVVVVLSAAGAVVAVSGVFGADGPSNASSDNGFATSLARIERRSLSRQTQFNGTLGYAGSYTVLGQAQGTLTWLPRVGQVIRRGQVLYRVDQAPVVLLYGSTPAYRVLAEGATGADVAQLNRDLVALGYVEEAEVDSAWADFSWATRAGVQKLQERLGADRTGTLGTGDAVFLPTAARVVALRATLGAAATGPVLYASSTARTVSVALQPELQSQVRAGDRVTITLPDGSATPGRVASVGRVATVPSSAAGGLMPPSGSGGSGGANSGPTVPVHITPTRPRATGNLDQAPVEVAITDETVRGVLAVPVNALLARAGGGYALEEVAGDGSHRLVQVNLGLFDDAAGMVEITGSSLAAGQRVVVPGQ